jgi:hypothetical protein
MISGSLDLWSPQSENRGERIVRDWEKIFWKDFLRFPIKYSDLFGWEYSDMNPLVRDSIILILKGLGERKFLDNFWKLVSSEVWKCLLNYRKEDVEKLPERWYLPPIAGVEEVEIMETVVRIIESK